MILLKKYHSILLLTLILIIFPQSLLGQSNFFLDEVRSLSELPMSKLMKIKTNLAENNDILEVDEEIEGRRLSVTLPKALPLKQIDSKSIKRHDDYWEEKGHDTKISKIFQLAITTLSFLAFGGYLFTLIISAMRRNSMSNDSKVIVLSNLQKYTRPKRYAFINDPMENEFDVDKMYQGMIMLSEKYTSYHKYH